MAERNGQDRDPQAGETAAPMREVARLRSALATAAARSARYASLLMHLPGVVYEATLDLALTDVQGAVERLTGHAASTFLSGQPRWADLVHPADREEVAASCRAAAASPMRGLEREYRILRRDGEERWVHEVLQAVADEGGVAVGFEGVVLDITTRRRAEHAQRQEHDLVERITQTTPAGIVMLDREGRITFCNATGRRVLGLSPEETTARAYDAPAWKITDLDGGPFPNDQLPFRQVMGTGRPVHNVRHAIERPDGRRTFLRIDGAPLMGAGGRLEGMVATIEDITAQVAVERSLGRRVAFEKLLLEATTRLLASPPEQVDEAIEAALGQIAAFIGASRAHIARAGVDGAPDQLTHEWCAPGVPSATAEYRIMQSGTFCHVIREVHRAGSLLIPTRESLPEDAGEERRAMERSDTASLCIVALRRRGQPQGALAFTAMGTPQPWDEETTTLLGMAANSLSAALEGRSAELALLASEQRARSLVESSPMGIHFYDLLPDGRLVFAGANPAADRILGVDNRQFVGKTIVEAFPPLSESEVPDRCRRAAELGEPWKTQQINYRDEQIAGAFEVYAFQTKPGSMAALFLDVTARLQAEEQLRLERFSVEHARDAIFWVDREGRVFEINEEACRSLGYSREELLALRLFDFAPRVSAEPWGEQFARMREVGAPRYETFHRRKDGTEFPVELMATYVSFEGREYMFGVARDITERVQAAEALRTSEASLKSIVGVAPVGIGLLRERVLLGVNERVCEMTGYAADELVGQSARVLFPSEEEFEATGREKYRQIAESGSGTVETRWQKKDGAVIDILLSSAPLDAGDLLQGVTFTALDITDRKFNDRLTRIQLDLLRAANEGLGLRETLSLCLDRAVDLSGMDSGGVFLLNRDDGSLRLLCHRGVNDGFAATVGRVDPGQPRHRLVMANAAAFLDAGELGREGRAALVHEELRSAAVLPLSYQGKVVGCLTVGSHVREEIPPRARLALETVATLAGGIVARAEAERALRVSEETQREFLANFLGIVYLVALPGFGLELLDGLVEQVTGYAREDLLSGRQRWPDLVHPDDREEWGRHADGLRQAEGAPVADSEYRIVRRDGQVRWVRDVAHSLRDKQGVPVAIHGAVYDVTERKDAEEERQRLEAQLRQQQKLESIGTLAAGVAHEINNPLNGILNYGQLLVNRLGEDDPHRRWAENIVRESERVSGIVRNLLSFSRQDQQHHSPARMADIVGTTLTLVRALFRKDQIVIECDVAEDLPRVRCRSQQIQQVLLNLLTNARDALNERFPSHDERKRIRITGGTIAREGREWLRLTVEDQGAGIAPEVGERVYDPFFTTKPREVGTGLGLAVSYGIVKAHGGTLTFESEADRGTRFHLDLAAGERWVAERSREGGSRD
jgi:PAS domain S-box-containing protein